MKKQILLAMVLSFVAMASSALEKDKVVGRCKILSDKTEPGKFTTLLGSFDVIRYKSDIPELNGSVNGMEVVEAYDGGTKPNAKIVSMLEFDIQKRGDEEFYTIEAIGMTRNHTAETRITLQLSELPHMMEFNIKTTESADKSADFAKPEQMLGTVRLNCKTLK